MKYFFLFFILFLGISFLIAGESLWDSDFQGYLTIETMVQEGDILNVIIDTSFSLSHIAAQKDSKTITFEYTGGEFGNLFSFLPDMKTGVDNNIKGNEEYSLKADMVARIVTLEDDYGYIEGSREISIDGKRESITISGYINTKDIDQQRRIPFSKIAQSRLVFQTFLYPSEFILNEDDIEDIIGEIAREGEEMASEEVPLGEDITEETSAAGEEEPIIESTPPEETGRVTPLKRGTTLTKEKKMELFLIYLNRMIDLLFY